MSKARSPWKLDRLSGPSDTRNTAFSLRPSKEEIMKNDDAQRFVQKMRDDHEFRRSVTGFAVSSELWDFLKRSGLQSNTEDIELGMF